MHLGEFAPAVEHFEKALSNYEPGLHVDDAFLYGLNPGIAMPCLAAWVLWFLGQPDQALVRIGEALTLARALSDPNCLAHALCFAAILHQLRREELMAEEHAEEGLAVSSEHELAMYPAFAKVIRGWSRLEHERREEAIEQMREGLEILQATGTEFIRPHFLALLAEALGKARQHEEALHVLDDALSFTHRSSERYYEAELYRLKGELLIMQSKCGKNSDLHPPVFAQAEDCFNESINIARQQKAKSWELRAATSMARLYMDQGKSTDARCVLTQVYDSFTEGFDTVELREAKVLHDRLS